MKRKKKSLAEVGTVLQAIKDPAMLKSWSEYLAGIDPWKGLGLTAEHIFERWTQNSSFRFLCATDPKNAKTAGFAEQDGLVVFSDESARPRVEELLRCPMPEGLEDGGYIAVVGTKHRRKGVGRYLLAAAERVISEKLRRVFLFVGETNAAAQRFYKSLGYEEVARAIDCLKPGNTEILMTKRLEE